MLRARDLSAGYGRSPILHDVDFHVEDGEQVAVLGANGAGKTTMMKVFARALPVMSGTLDFDGSPINRWRAADAARNGIGYVPQEDNVFAGLSVEENMRVSAARRGGEAGQAIDQAYERFPILRERAAQQAGSLSGGQRQILAVTSALLMRPRLLLLDEPTTGLAPLVVEQISGWIQEIAAGGMTTVWVVEQNPDVVLSHADRAYVLGGGQVLFEGKATDVSEDFLSDVLLGEHAS